MYVSVIDDRDLFSWKEGKNMKNPLFPLVKNGGMDIRPKHTSSFCLFEIPIRNKHYYSAHPQLYLILPAHPQKWIGGMHAYTHGPMHYATSSTCYLKGFPVGTGPDVL